MLDSIDLNTLQEFFRNNVSINLVRLQWVDLSGVPRTRILPKERCLHMAEQGSTCKVNQICMILPISSKPEYPSEGPRGWYLIPQWNTIRPLSYAPLHAAVMCNVQFDQPATGAMYCPRTLVENAIRTFKEKYNTTIKVGFEIEFVLLNPDIMETLELVEKILHALKVPNNPIWHANTETADQLEIALSPMPALEAIDALMFAEEAIRTISLQYGFKATLAPVPNIDGAHNGRHMHLSIGKFEHSEQFLAGVLDKVPALCAFGMPQCNSYERVCNHGAGLFVGWGSENRNLPIRKFCAAHWEFRFMDATANPHLFFAGVLLAGMNGIKVGKELSWKDCNVLLSAEDHVSKVAAYGITEYLPDSLAVALKFLEGDKDIEDWIGASMLAQYVKTKEKVIREFAKMAPEEHRLKFLSFF